MSGDVHVRFCESLGLKRPGPLTIYYGMMPKKCPKGGFQVKSELSFLGGAVVPATYRAPCPRSRH